MIVGNDFFNLSIRIFKFQMEEKPRFSNGSRAISQPVIKNGGTNDVFAYVEGFCQINRISLWPAWVGWSRAPLNAVSIDIQPVATVSGDPPRGFFRDGSEFNFPAKQNERVWKRAA